MSASIDQEDATDGASGAREVLVCWLETHAAGECDTATMQSGFLEGCRMHPDAPWDALALLDQYQRRNKLEPDVAAVLKREISEMVFGKPGAAAVRSRGGGRSQSVPVQRPVEPPRPTVAPETDEADEDEDEDEEADDDVAEEVLERRSPPIARPARASKVEIEPRPTTQSSVRVLRDRYELQDVIGRGADGVVYRALDRNRRHLDPSQRYVAIKLLHNEPPLSDDALIDLQRRAHRAQALVHPNRVRVLDFDSDGAARFLVMDLVPGHSLSSLLERDDPSTFAPARARRLIADIGAALADAHEHGLIVGNCTPRKIIVTPTGEAKLVDAGFGSANPILLEAEPYAARYASAERIDGDPPTASDDVYSFACIAYELLARRHPYGGRSASAARSQGLRPERIDSLSDGAWQALERGLRWHAMERDISPAQLAGALTKNDPASEWRALAEPAIRALRREPEVKPRRSGMQWLWWLILLASVAAVAWMLLTPSEQEEVRERIDAVEQAAGAKTAPAPASQSQPVDSARTLSDGQFIPAQPANEQPAAAVPSDAAQGSAPAEPSPSGSSAAPQPISPDAGVIGFTKDTYVVRESDVVVRIPVVRVHGTRGEVSFRWWTEGNSAEAGGDFGSVEPTREFIPAGQSSTVLHIPLVSDSLREGTEMFTVHIDEAGGGARLGELTKATVIIVDDD